MSNVLVANQTSELVLSQRNEGFELGRLIEVDADGETRFTVDQFLSRKDARQVALAILNATWGEDDEIEERAWGMEVHASDAQDVRF